MEQISTHRITYNNNNYHYKVVILKHATLNYNQHLEKLVQTFSLRSLYPRCQDVESLPLKDKMIAASGIYLLSTVTEPNFFSSRFVPHPKTRPSLSIVKLMMYKPNTNSSGPTLMTSRSKIIIIIARPSLPCNKPTRCFTRSCSATATKKCRKTLTPTSLDISPHDLVNHRIKWT